MISQIWDYRNPSMYVKSFIAHKNSVYTLEWHPEESNKLATGGRDKAVKVSTDCLTECVTLFVGESVLACKLVKI